MTYSTYAQGGYVHGSSQSAGTLATLRLRMADLERGRRIKSLRQAKAARTGHKVTQPQMAEACGVTLRAAQEWEYGGGIDDDHLPKLLDFLETDADYLLRGNEDPPADAPDLMDRLQSSPRAEQLDRIERKLDELLRITRRDPPQERPGTDPPGEGPGRLPPDEPIPPKPKPGPEDTDAEATG